MVKSVSAGGRRVRTSPRTTRARSRASAKLSRPVLLVEDDPAILGLLEELLRTEGYAVRTAMNGAEGLRQVEREAPALVVLDMRMPVMDGWGFARELKRGGISVPIVVMTAGEEGRRWANEIGADGFLAKPFDVDEVLRVIGKSAGSDGA